MGYKIEKKNTVHFSIKFSTVVNDDNYDDCTSRDAFNNLWQTLGKLSITRAQKHLFKIYLYIYIIYFF